ncbi:MAG: hypothetical protein Q4G33_15065 [bacterium]|nr:hypothetical protein [bacterium]
MTVFTHPDTDILKLSYQLIKTKTVTLPSESSEEQGYVRGAAYYGGGSDAE